MSRIKSTELQLRDGEIIAAARRNVPRRDIAEKYGITEQRVSQIVTQNLDPKFPDEDLRSWLLEGYFGDLQRLQEIKESKGRPVTSGKGDHVLDGNTGEYAYDTSTVTDAIRTAAQVRKNIAMLMGNEKPVVKAADETPEFHEALNIMRTAIQRANALETENAALRARLTALENGDVRIAEVVDQ